MFAMQRNDRYAVQLRRGHCGFQHLAILPPTRIAVKRAATQPGPRSYDLPLHESRDHRGIAEGPQVAERAEMTTADAIPRPRSDVRLAVRDGDASESDADGDDCCEIH